MYDSDGGGSPSQSAMMKVAKLVDSYLAEIAPDANLKLSKFIALAEILPDYARVVDDGLYRAVDIYLKVLQSYLMQLIFTVTEISFWHKFADLDLSYDVLCSAFSLSCFFNLNGLRPPSRHTQH